MEILNHQSLTESQPSIEVMEIPVLQHPDSQHSGLQRTGHIGELITYRPEQQHYGMFLNGFDWKLYGTGSFRRLPRGEEEAVFHLNRFATKLSRAMQFKKNDLAYYAALEDRTPGLGGIPVRKHWHFLMACPEHQLLKSVAEQLWMENGLCKIERYDPQGAAAFYMHKLVSQGASTYERNLHRLTYNGPMDLIEATKLSPYVKQRLTGKTTGEYLVLGGEK
jgi:hypothetical protein